MKRILATLGLLIGAASVPAQTLYVPGGTSTGIGNNTANGNVGIGTNSPASKFTVQAGHADTQLRLFSNQNSQTVDGANTALLTLWASEPGLTWSGTGIGNNVTNYGTASTLGRISTTRGASYIRFLDAALNLNVITAQGAAIEAMSIVSSGKVGVNTSAPQAALDVFNGLHIHGSPAYASTGAGLEILKINETLGSISMINAPDRTERELRFYGTPLTFFQAGLERMRISSNGYLGVGTVTPQSLLDVQGYGNSDIVASFRSRRPNAYLALYAGSADDAAAEIAFSRSGPAAGDLYVGGNATGNIVFRSGGYLHRMFISPSGDVGIGTSAPTHKLSVNGTVRAKEVIVDNSGWPDFVFEAGYRLAPLNEVEAHIQEKKHLPGIPSASEIAEHGVSMGEMQAKLLSKIEELTLHVIAQSKDIAALRSQNQSLQRQLTELSNPAR